MIIDTWNRRWTFCPCNRPRSCLPKSGLDIDLQKKRHVNKANILVNTYIWLGYVCTDGSSAVAHEGYRNFRSLLTQPPCSPRVIPYKFRRVQNSVGSCAAQNPKPSVRQFNGGSVCPLLLHLDLKYFTYLSIEVHITRNYLNDKLEGHADIGVVSVALLDFGSRAPLSVTRSCDALDIAIAYQTPLAHVVLLTILVGLSCTPAYQGLGTYEYSMWNAILGQWCHLFYFCLINRPPRWGGLFSFFLSPLLRLSSAHCDFKSTSLLLLSRFMQTSHGMADAVLCYC